MPPLTHHIELYRPAQSGLNPSDKLDDLYCNLEFGVGNNRVRLTGLWLIEWAAQVREFQLSMKRTSEAPNHHTLKMGQPYTFHWEREAHGSPWYHFFILQNSTEIYQDKLHADQLENARNGFWLQLLSILCDSGLYTAAEMFWRPFDDKLPPGTFRFNISDRVKTISSIRVKAERVGYVIARKRSEDGAPDTYRLLVGGKEEEQAYFERDLELLEVLPDWRSRW